MTHSRRDFIKFIVAGSVAAGCPLEFGLAAPPTDAAASVEGEQYDICHQVRDGHQFPRPAVTRRCDVAIIGAGVSGLSAAYFLRSMNFLLLEKESHWGGNAYLQDYQGQNFANGAAFDEVGSESYQLLKELGVTLLPINKPDSSIIGGKWVPDTWGAGLDELPYPVGVRDSFKKFKRDVLAMNIHGNAKQFDSEPFTKYLAAYAPEVKLWWDGYGPSNWGAAATNTSALVGLGEMQNIAEESHADVRVTLPGGNGVHTRKLSEVLLAKHKERMLGGATVIAVEPEKDPVRVTFLHEGKIQALAARVVVMASAKYITSKIVSGIPEEQHDAMDQIRYCPYPVINFIFDKPVYSGSYDTWCTGSTFTDFIVADWTLRNQPGYRAKFNILTLYTPLPERSRSKLLSLDGCREIAASALRDFQKLLPEFNVDPVEVHIFRRGHPMFMSTPGNFTQVIPKARVPLERVFFANTDSEGPVSGTPEAVRTAQRAAEWVHQRLAGKTHAQATAAVGYACGD